jgi:hypothetical protein
MVLLLIQLPTEMSTKKLPACVEGLSMRKADNLTAIIIATVK